MDFSRCNLTNYDVGIGLMLCASILILIYVACRRGWGPFKY